MKSKEVTTVLLVVLLAVILTSSSARTYANKTTTIHVPSTEEEKGNVDVNKALATPDVGSCYKCWRHK
ncbi:hypothetical protein QVD17_32340 [Tagetes erecta]|uniref:Uncharacterized protein n=1 Tax=Tagetes erecta TaxID=13708 RepID=A0AAD8K623_TARER|nr:hypothetical protein QVD17_32340 [Tagetes erecta]